MKLPTVRSTAVADTVPTPQVNLKTQDATFDVPNIHSSSNTLLVDGSFITEAPFPLSPSLGRPSLWHCV